MAKNYETMTLNELEIENKALMLQKDAIKEEQRTIAKAIDVKKAAKKLDKMNDAEIDAIKKALE